MGNDEYVWEFSVIRYELVPIEQVNKLISILIHPCEHLLTLITWHQHPHPMWLVLWNIIFFVEIVVWKITFVVLVCKTIILIQVCFTYTLYKIANTAKLNFFTTINFPSVVFRPTLKVLLFKCIPLNFNNKIWLYSITQLKLLTSLKTF